MGGACGAVLTQDSTAEPGAVCAVLATTGKRAQRCNGTVGWMSGRKPLCYYPNLRQDSA